MQRLALVLFGHATYVNTENSRPQTEEGTTLVVLHQWTRPSSTKIGTVRTHVNAYIGARAKSSRVPPFVEVKLRIIHVSTLYSHSGSGFLQWDSQVVSLLSRYSSPCLPTQVRLFDG